LFILNLNFPFSEKLVSVIDHYKNKLDSSIPAVLAGHLTVTNGIFSGSEKRAIYGNDPTVLPSQLAVEPFDYVGLGHLHRYQNLNSNGYPAVVYSGSIERVDFGERKEEKGFCYVKIPEKNRCEHEFIKVKTRKFIQVDVKIKGEIEQTEQIIKEIEKNNINNSVIKIVYHLEENCQDFVNIKKVQNICSKAHYLVGIVPVYKISERKSREIKPINMSLDDLINHYIKTNQTLSSRKEDIYKKIDLIKNKLSEDQL